MYLFHLKSAPLGDIYLDSISSSTRAPGFILVLWPILVQTMAKQMLTQGERRQEPLCELESLPTVANTVYLTFFRLAFFVFFFGPLTTNTET